MRSILVLILAICLISAAACRRSNSDAVTVALSESFSTFDTLTTEKNDAAAERVRNLLFNSLVKKSENFDYVGELAEEIKTSEDGKAITFTLRDNVKFHNGHLLTSADVKYTFDSLFESKGFKSSAFVDMVPVLPGEVVIGADGKPAKTKPEPHIVSIETPDSKTVVFNLARPGLKNELLSNLVAIPIVAQGTAETLKESPIGSGPFKFVNFDRSQNIVEFAANTDYWDGPPKFPILRVKTVTDASALQAELQSGGVDIAPVPSNLPPDSIKSLGSLPNLKVEQFDGSNIQYLGFNVSKAPLDNAKVRQAMAYAIDREKIIKELLSDQGKIASSVLPEASWAYSPGTQYSYDPEKAKQLLKEAGYSGEEIKIGFASGNAAYNSYVQAIQSSLLAAGMNVVVDPLNTDSLRENLAKGIFQSNLAVWIGGNQDPIFFKKLFTTSSIPSEMVTCCNRARYSNAEVDKLVDTAVNEPDRAKAKEQFVKAWQIISNDLPLFPLWYPANMVVSNKRIGNIKISPSGDWSFIKDITVH